MRSKTARTPFRVRPLVEPLEDRLAPATFTVINTDDAGTGSLRWAIIRADARTGADTIAFNIAGAGVHTINLLSPLPAITDKVKIAGNTQPGFAGSPVIELNGTGAGAGADGLVINPGGAGSVVRGLVINRFNGDSIGIRADDCRIAGNFIGTNAAGTADLGNGSGVFISDGASGNVIGGTTSGGRNVISGNGVGVVIQGSGTTGNRLLGNFIGTDVTGTLDRGNSLDGVLIFQGARGNVVGGTATGARNVISGNDTLGNSGGVVIFGNASGNRIGGAAAGAGNVIAHTVGRAVRIESGSGNSVLRNSIFNNGDLGIDLGADGITANDPNDADSGANAFLNFPELTLARLTAAGDLRVKGSINMQHNKTLRIEFFASPTADPSGHGEGKKFLGFITVQMGTNNTVGFNTLLDVSGVKLGHVITATATDELGNTSEFSLARTVT